MTDQERSEERSGGVNISGGSVQVGRDLVGRDVKNVGETSTPGEPGSTQAAPPPPGVNEQVPPSQVREILATAFSDEELRDLSFDLGIDYENLPAEGKSGKARELVWYCRRHGRFADLVAAVRRLRPHLSLGG